MTTLYIHCTRYIAMDLLPFEIDDTARVSITTNSVTIPRRFLFSKQLVA